MANRAIVGAVLISLMMPAAVGAQRSAPAVDREAVGRSLVEHIDARRSTYAGVAKEIWGFAEVGFQEQKSSALLQQQLKAAGFQVTAGVAGIPTAFVATFGSGNPVIGIVGEFDALPGLSREAQTATRHAIEDNAPGHGCGHNLLGTGALAAAIAVKEWLAASGHAGTLRDDRKH